MPLVDLYEFDGSRLLQRSVPLTDIMGDDTDGLDQASTALRLTGRAIIGGGATPAFLIVLAHA